MEKEVSLWRVIALDGEFSGPRVDKNYMVVLGAAVFNCYANAETGKLSLVCVEKCHWAMQPPLGMVMDEQTKREFWDKPENQKNLAGWASEACSPGVAMTDFAAWLRDTLSGNQACYLVVDSVQDVMWINHYLQFHGNSMPLHLFNGYTGMPFISDDIYRGFLKSLNLWGLDAAIAKKTGIQNPASGNHDAEDDAYEIGCRFAQVAFEFLKPSPPPLLIHPEDLPELTQKSVRFNPVQGLVPKGMEMFDVAYFRGEKE